jgi:outer membrane protein assembly factor BamB
VANGVLYVGSDDFSVYALDALTGEVLWSFVTGGKACSGPTVVDGTVYMSSHDRNFYAFGLP